MFLWQQKINTDTQHTANNNLFVKKDKKKNLSIKQTSSFVVSSGYVCVSVSGLFCYTHKVIKL